MPSTTLHPEARHALYYPYIHVRDENWLKGAILAFQQVRRIVPDRFTVKDEGITGPYAELEGPAGPLLEAVSATGPSLLDTQNWLRRKVEERVDDLTAKYSEDETRSALGDDADEFQMHAGKFIDPDFVIKLKRANLAWHSRDASDPDSMNWLTMHPMFGAAMMSVIAIALARSNGLSVVTPSGPTHHELLANREEDVFEKLLALPRPAANPDDAGVTAEELAHVVITTGFDLTRLQPEDILNLLKEGKDLRSFRATVANYAGSIPKGVEGEERLRRLKQGAEAVLEDWRDYTKSLPKFAKEVLVDTALDKASEKLVEAGLTGAAAGAIAGTVVGAVPGLLITIVVTAGVKMFRKPDTPLRFLSKVNDVAGKRIGSIYVPQWSALAAQSA